jgi:hypothetical protein
MALVSLTMRISLHPMTLHGLSKAGMTILRRAVN